jgi:uncharacterized protein
MYALFSFLPMLISLVFLLGGYAFFEVPLNLMSVLAIPLIIGIGIDDGVHTMYRFKQEQEASIITVMSEVGYAVFLTSLTTVLAFGSMTMSSMQGNISMGWILLIGVVLCYLLTLTLIPALLAMKNKSKN